MSALCVVDQIPATEGSLCTACSRRFAARVRRIPSLLVELDVTITKQARQAADRGASSSERSLVFNASASDAAAVLRRALQAVVWDAERGARFEFDAAAVGLVARAVAGWSSVVRGDQVLDRYEQVEIAVRRATRVIDREPAREVVGSCDCGAQLVVSGERRRGEGDGPPEVVCRRCGVVWELDDLAQQRVCMVEGHLARFVSAAEMSALFAVGGICVSAAGVRQWVRRGQLRLHSGPWPLHGVWAADAWELWRSLHGQTEDGEAA